MRPGIKPGKPPSEGLDLEAAHFQETLVDGGNLQFSAPGRADRRRNVNDFIRIEIQSDHGIIALGLLGLLWYRLSQKKSPAEIWQLVKELDWETIAFLIGIFVVLYAAIGQAVFYRDAKAETCNAKAEIEVSESEA